MESTEYNMMDLVKEIENLSNENNRLKEENFIADCHYINMVDRLTTKDNEIDELKVELNRISMSKHPEEKYITAEQSCLRLKQDLATIQKELALEKRKYDFTEFDETYSCCKTVNNTVSNVTNACRIQMSSKDEVIAEMEREIAEKDDQLRLATEELADHSECRTKQQNLEKEIAEIKHVVMNRERLIEKMKELMTQKSVKINLLLLKIKELETNLDDYQVRMGEAKEIQSSPAGFVGCIVDERGTMKKYRSQGTVHRSQDIGDEYQEAREYCFNENIGYELFEEFPQPQDTVVHKLIMKIRNTRSKIQYKLSKEIQKKMKVSEVMSISQTRFNEIQSEIENVRKFIENNYEPKDYIRHLICQEQQLSEIIESSDYQTDSINSRIVSCNKALANLDTLSQFFTHPN